MPVLPGGAFVPVQQQPGLIPGIIGSLFGPSGGAEVQLPFGGALFRTTAGVGVRAKRTIMVPHPISGEPVFFGHLGRPLLFSRDLQAARKVDRLARRARRSRRGR